MITAELIAARRQHIRDAAPCEGCGATLANCKASRGQDPTAPEWFGCCARGVDLQPCRHIVDTGALQALLDEVEAGTVRTVEEATPRPVEREMRWDEYFDQGLRWKPNGKPMVAVADMDPAWRHNAARWLERNAAAFAAKYSISVAMWFARECASPIGPSEMSQDHLEREIDDEAGGRASDPVGWIRNTALFRALVNELPSGAGREALAERAKHYSTCPSRADAAAGCSCRPVELTPEWTLS